MNTKGLLIILWNIRMEVRKQRYGFANIDYTKLNAAVANAFDKEE
jgi:hypothetical protein